MINVKIGKHTLESLTAGMYINPFDLFREYVQNAVDSFDAAYDCGVLKPGSERLTVTLDGASKRIIIEDNGTGIAANGVRSALTDIGNSQKRSDVNRGFRGIGRLAGLSYVERLRFVTSSMGEPTKTTVTFDAQQLKALLIPRSGGDMDVSEVFSQVMTLEQSSNAESSHFFRVELEGIPEDAGLLNYDRVHGFLAETSPVPFDPSKFSWGREIETKLERFGLKLMSYNIFLRDENRVKRVYKPYANELTVDRTRKLEDNVRDIHMDELRSSQGELLAVVWHATTGYLGTILDDMVKGLRLRKGNILVGDKSSLSNIFREPRFNGWHIGEVHVVSPCIIPNSRRDGFENNECYAELTERLRGYIYRVSQQMRESAASRSTQSETMHAAQLEIDGMVEELDAERIAPPGRATVKRKAVALRETLSGLELRSEDEFHHLRDLFETLDVLIGSSAGSTMYKAINLLPDLSIQQRKVLEKVFATLEVELDADEARSVTDAIVRDFSRRTS